MKHAVFDCIILIDAKEPGENNRQPVFSARSFKLCRRFLKGYEVAEDSHLARKE